jgi:cyclase
VTTPASEPLDPATRPRLEQLSPGLAAIVQPDGGWGLSNAGLVQGGDAVVLVDTFFTERRNDALRDIVAMTAPRTPTIVVNTHAHGDHVYGNGWFPGAAVVSHEDTRRAVVRLDPSVSARRFAEVDFGRVEPTAASVTFRADLDLHAGDLDLLIFYPGLAHCQGNAAVYVPGQATLFAGDLLLKYCTPAFANGSAAGYLTVLDRLRELPTERVVPGHGPVCGSEVIEETERYVRFVLGLARRAVRDGSSPLDAARAATLGEFAAWHDAERLVGNLYRAMAEVTDGPEKAAFDAAAMWRDTLAYHGAALTSRA